MKNKKVATKMLLTFGVTLILALAMIGVSMRTILSVRSNYNNILSNQVQVTQAVLESEMEVNSIARQLRDMALFGYDTATINSIQESIDTINAATSTIDKLYTEEDGLDQQYINDVEDWESVFTDIDEALQANDSARVAQLIQNECTPKLNQAVSTGQALIAQLTTQSNSAVDDVERSSTRDMVILCILIAVIIIGGIALNLYMIRSIVSPCGRPKRPWWPSATATCPILSAMNPKMRSAVSATPFALPSVFCTTPLKISSLSPSVWLAAICPVP